jgi:hypothetical protein
LSSIRLLGELLEPNDIPKKQVSHNDPENKSPIQGNGESAFDRLDETGVASKEIVHESVSERRETTTRGVRIIGVR